MNYCKVTKLNASVSGQGLPKLGCARFVVNFTATTQAIVVQYISGASVIFDSSKAIKVKTSKDAEAASIAEGTHIELTATNHGFYIFPKEEIGDYEIYIGDKYQIKGVQSEGNNITDCDFKYMTNLTTAVLENSTAVVDLSDFKHTNIKTILNYNGGHFTGSLDDLPDSDYTILTMPGTTNVHIAGNINKFANKTNMNIINMESNDLTGNIENLGNLTNLNALNLYHTIGITGDICTLCAALWTNTAGHAGKRGTLKIYLSNTSCTINNDVINVRVMTATFNDAGITISAGNYTYTYNGTTWTKSASA